MMSTVMLSIVMLCVILISAVMTSVVAHLPHLSEAQSHKTFSVYGFERLEFLPLVSNPLNLWVRLTSLLSDLRSAWRSYCSTGLPNALAYFTTLQRKKFYKIESLNAII